MKSCLEAIHRRKLQFPSWRQYLAAIIASLQSFSAGIVLGWTSPSISSLLQAYSHVDKSTNITILELSEDDTSWIASLAPLGALVGALPSGNLADILGRKTILLLLTVLYIMGWALTILKDKPIQIIFIARFISGVAVGATTVVTPMYTSEIAEDKVRGALGSYLQLMITLGILWSYLLGMFMTYIWLSIASCFIPVIFFFSFLIMPESPVYLLSRDRTEDAESSLLWLRSGNAAYDVSSEIVYIKNFLKSNSIRMKDCRRAFSPHAIRALIITMGLMFFQQLSGINAVIFYSEKIFEDAGGLDISPEQSVVIVGVMQVVATYCSSLLVERIGRRVLLLSSDTIMAVCLLVLSVYLFMRGRHEDVTFIAWLPLLSLSVYIIFFALGFGPLPWLMMSEIVPMEVKGAVSALAVSLNWTLVFIVTKAFEPMISYLGPPATFIIFCTICALGTVFVALFVPETKGKSLSQIQRELGNFKLAV